MVELELDAVNAGQHRRPLAPRIGGVPLPQIIHHATPGQRTMDTPIEAAPAAVKPREPAGEEPAAEKPAELLLDEPRQRVPFVGAGGFGPEGLKVIPDHLIQHAVLGRLRGVVWGSDPCRFLRVRRARRSQNLRRACATSRRGRQRSGSP